MPSSRSVDAFVRRLEDRIVREVAGRGHVALAYSGGLSSTLVAMITRKRCDLECFVAGREGSPDVHAAEVGKTYFDYRVKHILLDRTTTQGIGERLAHLRPHLSRRNLDSLIPLHAVLERTRERPVMSGFGSPRMDGMIGAVLRRAEVSSPLHDSARGRPLPRALLRAAAISLGLPNDVARTPHRHPAAGAGIDDFILSEFPKASE
jgi:Asparagine synthase